MLPEIQESDWKKFRKLSPTLLERFSHRILGEIRSTIDGPGSSHERYLSLWKLIEERDKQLADAFNDHRRSTALQQLSIMRTMDMITADECAQFSDETRQFIERAVSFLQS